MKERIMKKCSSKYIYSRTRKRCGKKYGYNQSNCNVNVRAQFYFFIKDNSFFLTIHIWAGMGPTGATKDSLPNSGKPYG